jgi:hypothetical protein
MAYFNNHTGRGVFIPAGRGGKNRRALLAGNVKQLQEIRLNPELLLKI